MSFNTLWHFVYEAIFFLFIAVFSFIFLLNSFFLCLLDADLRTFKLFVVIRCTKQFLTRSNQSNPSLYMIVHFPFSAHGLFFLSGAWISGSFFSFSSTYSRILLKINRRKRGKLLFTASKSTKNRTKKKLFATLNSLNLFQFDILVWQKRWRRRAVHAKRLNEMFEQSQKCFCWQTKKPFLFFVASVILLEFNKSFNIKTWKKKNVRQNPIDLDENSNVFFRFSSLFAT